MFHCLLNYAIHCLLGHIQFVFLISHNQAFVYFQFELVMNSIPVNILTQSLQ